MGKAKNGKEKKKVTKTPRSVLKTYMGYMNRIRSEEPELWKSLPPDKEVGTPQTLESFLFAAEVMGVLNIDEEAPFNEASYEKYKTELQIQAELLKDTGQWPPPGFTLPAEKQSSEDEEEQEQEEEREDVVWKGEEQPIKEDGTPEPEPENQDEDENGEEQEEEMMDTHGADALVSEPKQELLQSIEPEPRQGEPSPQSTPPEEPPKDIHGQPKDLFQTGKAIKGTIKAWYPNEGCGHIWLSKRPWEDEDPQFTIFFDDIVDEELKADILKRSEEWPRKKRDKNRPFDERKILISNLRYYVTPLVVHFIPDTSEGPGKWRATKVIRYERPENEKFIRKGDVKELEEIKQLGEKIEKLTKALDAVSKDRTIVNGATLVVIKSMVSTSIQEELEKAKETISSSTNDSLYGRISRKEFDSAMDDLFFLKQWRDQHGAALWKWIEWIKSSLEALYSQITELQNWRSEEVEIPYYEEEEIS